MSELEVKVAIQLLSYKHLLPERFQQGVRSTLIHS
jgi:hypothetical protein